jgi:hypothetical protein
VTPKAGSSRQGKYTAEAFDKTIAYKQKAGNPRGKRLSRAAATRAGLRRANDSVCRIDLSVRWRVDPSEGRPTSGRA